MIKKNRVLWKVFQFGLYVYFHFVISLWWFNGHKILNAKLWYYYYWVDNIWTQDGLIHPLVVYRQRQCILQTQWLSSTYCHITWWDTYWSMWFLAPSLLLFMRRCFKKQMWTNVDFWCMLCFSPNLMDKGRNMIRFHHHICLAQIFYHQLIFTGTVHYTIFDKTWCSNMEKPSYQLNKWNCSSRMTSHVLECFLWKDPNTVWGIIRTKKSCSDVKDALDIQYQNNVTVMRR